MGDDRLSGAAECRTFAEALAAKFPDFDPTWDESTREAWIGGAMAAAKLLRPKEPQPPKDPQATVRRQETSLALERAIDAGPTHWRDEISLEDLKTCLEALQEGGKRENE